MKWVRWLGWLLRIVLFAALFLFALENLTPVTLRFYLDQSWQLPLAGALFVFFTLGALLGVIACLSRILRQRREILALRRQLRERAQAGDERSAALL